MVHRPLAFLFASLLGASTVLAACAPQAPRPGPAPTAAPSKPAAQPTTAAKPAEAAKPAAAEAAKPAAAKPAAAKPAATAPIADKRAQKLTVAIPADTGPLNIYSSDSKFDWMVELVFDKLLSPSPYAEKPLPALAESATQIDQSTWVVKVRDGVTWHDGKPFTAEDVVFTYTSFRDGSPNRHTHHVNDVPKIDRIVAEDARTVRFDCGYPCPSLGTVTFADLPILPKHIWEKVDKPQTFQDLPIGTGPYKLVELRPDQQYRFVANESYFLGKPLVDELVMPIIKDPTTTFTALRTGEIDVAARDVPPELLAELGRLPGVALAQTTPLSLVELRVNYERPPFDKPEFRRAFSQFIDRKAIVDTVLLGHGEPGLKGYTHPNSPWTRPGEATPFDRDGAKKLLDDLQFTDRNGDGVRETPDGQALEFGLIVPSNEPVWMRVAELISKQATEVGITLTVQPLDAGTVRRIGSTRQFDVYVSEIGPHGVADPDQFIMSHRSGYLWKAGLPYPAFDALWEEWKSTASIDARKQVSFKMQELHNKQPVSVPLYYPQTTTAYRTANFDQWQESRGYGIVHKWSLLPAAARNGAVVTP
ncbi:MAG: ABC transporter substrate-binding protein [Chloroflexi bacterium]|nr:ABC transporter substrate-binding protein [Chloroflexota bacterium]